MADILERGDAGPLRVVAGVAAREMRVALFLSLDSPDIKLVATASTVAEALTHTRSLQPEAMIVTDDLLTETDVAASITAIRECMSLDCVFVVGPSAPAIAEATGVASVEESSDLLALLLAVRSRRKPPVTGVASGSIATVPSVDSAKRGTVVTQAAERRPGGG